MCAAQTFELLNSSWFAAGKARLIFINSGSFQVGNEVGHELKIFERGGELYVDSSTKIYGQLGCYHSAARSFVWTRMDNIKGLLNWPYLVMTKSRLPFAGSGGDPFLQAGTLILSPKGDVVYRVIEEYPGYPRIDTKAISRVIEQGDRPSVVSVQAAQSAGLSGMHIGVGVLVALTLGKGLLTLRMVVCVLMAVAFGFILGQKAHT